MKMTRRSFLSASALTLLSCQLAPAARADCLLSDLFHGADTALPPKPLTAKVVDANPFMGRSESNIHHDCYNTDSTDAVLPVGICPEVNVAMEKTNPNASPAIFFDNFDNPVSPFLGGLAIRDLDAEEVRTIGFFSPAKHDGGGYLIQSSYSFVDGRNLIVCPTSHNHVLMLRATDENGTPLPVFEKVLDINIKEAAERVLGRSLEQNLLSIVFDYDGNLWFVTGGFRIYPSRGQQGAMGYISHNAIETILAGGAADLDHEVHVYAPAPGEGAENGIASCREGAVILTNLACYLLRANGGVEVVWRTPYDSVGAKDSREGAATTGGGLAWGGGCSPSLSKELVFFTDNLSVQPPEAVSNRIYALMTVLKGQAEIEMLALNSKESFEDNKRHYRQRAAEEDLPVISRLLEADAKSLDRLQIQMATAREFFILVRLREETGMELHTHLSRIQKSLEDQGFKASLASGEDLKRMLGVYFEQNATTEKYEDYDGERWIILND